MSDVVAPEASTGRGGLWSGSPVGDPADLAAGHLLDAVLRCLGRWGVAKTTIDDIAREAGCSRATVYRHYPGGKDRLLLAAAEREVAGLLAELADQAASADDLADALTRILVRGVQRVRAHGALQYLLEHEPGVVLPFVAFDGVEPLFEVAVAVLAPTLRHVAPDAAAAEVAAEWVVRVGLSYSLDEHPTPLVDLGDPTDARAFVLAFGLPGLTAVPTEPRSVPPGAGRPS